MALYLSHGPAGSQKSGHFLKKVSGAICNNAKVVLLVPNTLAQIEAETKLAYLSPQNGFFSKNTVTTFDDFLLNTLKANLARVHVPTPRIKRGIARRLIAQNKYTSLKAYIHYPTLLNKLLATVELLKKATLGIPEVKQLFKNHPELIHLVSFFEDYQNVLAEYHYVDKGDLYRLTLEGLKNKTLKISQDELYIDRLFPLDLGKEEIIRQMGLLYPQKNIFLNFSFNYSQGEDPYFYPCFSRLGEMAVSSDYQNPPHAKAPVYISKEAHPGIELTTIIENIKKLVLTENVPPSQITLVVPHDTYYQKRFPELLYQANLPFNSSYQGQLAPLHELPSEFKNPQTHLTLSEILSLNTQATLESFDDDWLFEKEFIYKDFTDVALIEKWKNDEKSELRVPYPTSRDGIKVLTVNEAFCLDSNFLFVAGFTRKNFSHNVSDHPFFDAEMLEAPYMREVLQSPSYLHERNRHWVTQIIERTQNTVFLSYPKFSWDKKEQAAQEVSFPVIDISKEKTSLSKVQEQQARDYPGIKENRFSISSLDLYLKCPYKYYARHILNIDDKPEDELDLTADIKGMFIHRVLERIYRENSELYHDALEYDLYLNKLADEARAIVETEKPNFFGLTKLPTVVVKDFIRRAEMAIIEIIKNEVLMLRDKKKTALPRYFEWAFGSGKIAPLKIRYQHHDIFVTGRIDRIDVNEASQSFTVIDYKTGEIDSTLSLKSGDSIQIPLYLMAVQSLLLSHYSSGQGALLSLKEAGKKSSINFGQNADTDLSIKSSRLNSDDWALLQSRITQLVGETVLKINQGKFEPSPQKNSLCTFCSYKQICHYRASDDDLGEDAA